MTTTLPTAMNKNVIENTDIARQRLETARHGCDTMAATFLDYTLGAVMGPDLRDPIVLLSEQGKYSNAAYIDFDMACILILITLLQMCQNIARAVGKSTARAVDDERLRIVKALEPVSHISGVCESINSSTSEAKQSLTNAEGSWNRIGTSSKLKAGSCRHVHIHIGKGTVR